MVAKPILTWGPMLSHTKKKRVGMALNEAKLPLILYHEVKTIEHVIMRTLCHFSIVTLIHYFSASAIPTPFLIFNVFSTCSCPF